MATILAVDDLRSMRDLVKSVLENRGHEVITKEDAEDKKPSAKTAGASGWIQKPFNPERLVPAVESTMSRS